MSLLVLFACATTAALAMPPTALADGSDGGQRFITSGGAQAAIETQNPIVAVDTSDWVMVARQGDMDTYAQVGWAKDKPKEHTTPWVFWEAASSISGFDPGPHYKNAIYQGNTYTYIVNNDGVAFAFYAGGTYEGQVSFSTLQWGGPTYGWPNEIDIQGEAYAADDRMPGSSTNKCNVSTAQYKHYYNEGWSTLTLWSYNRDPFHTNGGDYRNDIPSGSQASQWGIWDTRN